MRDAGQRPDTWPPSPTASSDCRAGCATPTLAPVRSRASSSCPPDSADPSRPRSPGATSSGKRNGDAVRASSHGVPTFRPEWHSRRPWRWSDACIAGSTGGGNRSPSSTSWPRRSIAIFVGALLLIEVRRLGLLPFEWLPSNHFHAVRLGFNLLIGRRGHRPGVRAHRKPRAHPRAAVRDPLPHPAPPEPQGAGPRIRATEMGGPPPFRLADGRRRRGSRRRVRARRSLLSTAERRGRAARGAHPRALRRLEGGGCAGGARRSSSSSPGAG